jgi:hypothetical protein
MAVLDRVPLDRINTEARDVEIGRAVLTVLAGVLFAVGWLAAKTVGLLVLAVAWSVAAVRVGWSVGWESPRGRSRI